MKILVVIENSRSYYRFVAPILAAIGKKSRGTAITLLAPDVGLIHDWEILPDCKLQKPVEEVGFLTRQVRKLRSVISYLYWVLLDVQSEAVLDSKSEKYLLEPLPHFRSLLNPNRVKKISQFFRRFGLNNSVARTLLTFFRSLELLNPPDRKIVEQIRAIVPDVIMVTPAIYPRSYEIEYARVGIGLGIPTVILIASWDNLTSKGVLSLISDRILVWNDIQVQEAQKYHAIPSTRVVPVGAPVFDKFFGQRYVWSKPDFYRFAKLDPRRPFVLWAASSRVACADERIIVRHFIGKLRNYPQLSEIQVLVRPHPNDVTRWLEWEINDAPVWPNSDFPNSEEAIRGLYNSIINAVAVVGLSTTLFIEAGILDRPCALIKASEIDKSAQYNKYIHFNYLLRNGFPIATEDESDCARWLAEIVDGRDAGGRERARFVSSFLRPCGINRPAAEVAADVILELVGKVGIYNTHG